MKRTIFRMPTNSSITGRASSITHAFVYGIIPILPPNDSEVKEALTVLGMDEEHINCAYCGGAVTEWDHLHPLVKDMRPTGYVTEIHNLVPSCGKCNQSKRNLEWKAWMQSNAPLSPKTRGVPDLARRIERLEAYEQEFKPLRIDFESAIGAETWGRYWTRCGELHEMLRESQKLAEAIKSTVDASIER